MTWALPGCHVTGGNEAIEAQLLDTQSFTAGAAVTVFWCASWLDMDAGMVWLENF